MAHAGYDCCAICDSKQSYNEEAYTKEEICSHCLKALRAEGLSILDVSELLAWIQSTEPTIVRATLISVGFSFCYYPNAVDRTVAYVLSMTTIPSGKRLEG